MTDPTQSAVDAAATTLSAAEEAIVTASAGAIDQVATDNAAAITHLDNALGIYSNVTTAKISEIVSIRAQLAAFTPTFEALKQRLAALQPSSDDPAGA